MRLLVKARLGFCDCNMKFMIECNIDVEDHKLYYIVLNKQIHICSWIGVEVMIVMPIFFKGWEGWCAWTNAFHLLGVDFGGFLETPSFSFLLFSSATENI